MKKKNKVLVVDDDPTITTLLQSRLEANFFEVVTASDGVEGLEKFKKEKPSLIILDIEMPKMDGYSFILEFKKAGDLQKTPIIMLTAKEEMKDIFSLEGINDYIVKPFRMSDLLDKIGKHLSSHNKKVLVVDDEAEFCDLVENRLKLNGYSVFKAYDGEKGLSIVKREAPDLVLLDIMLPEVDGYSFCRKVKADDQYKETAVIMISGKVKDLDNAQGREAGADAFISKPFDAEDLLQKMKEILWD